MNRRRVSIEPFIIGARTPAVRVAVIVVLVAALAACGDKKAPDSDKGPRPEPKTEPRTDDPALSDVGETDVKRPAPTPVEADGLIGEEVTYQAGGVTMKGYLVHDGDPGGESKGKRPGVLVVHEWWGHNDYARERARMLAGMGYTALAVDMYGDGKKAEHPDDAGKFAAEATKDPDVTRARFVAALELLKKHETTDPDKMAAIGYCFGGGVVLHAARFGLDLDAVVSFHGSLATETPARPGAVKARVLVFNGAADPFVKPEHIAAFKKEMEDAGVDYHFESYEGVKHSFTSKAADEYGKKFELPLAYDAEADQKSWAGMKAAFDDVWAR